MSQRVTFSEKINELYAVGKSVWFRAGKEQACCHMCLGHSQGEISGWKKVAAACDLHILEKECEFTLQGLF